jgi:radical SAM superfamily enzyme YgiQ (UPF0313 family)
VGSGDDEVLAASGRDLTVETARSDISMIRAGGMEVEARFRLGYPKETEDSAARTARLVVELNPDRAVIDLVIPYPGTGIYEMALRGAGGYSLLSDDWSEYAWYGGSVLDLKGLHYRKLAAWRRQAVAMLYLKNRRPMDMVRYLWARRSALGFVLARKLGLRLVAKERFTG